MANTSYGRDAGSTSYRDKDRTHLRDMISVELIHQVWCERFPAERASRLQALLDDPVG